MDTKHFCIPIYRILLNSSMISYSFAPCFFNTNMIREKGRIAPSLFSESWKIIAHKHHGIGSLSSSSLGPSLSTGVRYIRKHSSGHSEFCTGSDPWKSGLLVLCCPLLRLPNLYRRDKNRRSQKYNRSSGGSPGSSSPGYSHR